MSYGYWFRLILMAFALAGVLVIMRSLNQTAIRPKMTSAKHDVPVQINLCPTRVTRLQVGDVEISENTMQWSRRNHGHVETLDPVAVEKWFSRNCAVTGIKTSASADVHTAMEIFFVTGEPQKLLQSAGGEFEWEGLSFRSSQMELALKELLELPLKESK